MNGRLIHTIYKSEELYNRNNNSKTTFLLILRYIEASILLEDKNIYLQKAMNIIVNTKKENINLNLFKTYIHISLKQYDEADIILKWLKSFKSWLKNENKLQYAIMLLLLSQNEFEKNHLIRGKKHFKTFSEFIDSLPNNNVLRILKSIFISMYLPNLKQVGIDEINYVYRNNSRSPLLFMLINSQYYIDDILLNRALFWNMVQDINNKDLSSMIKLYLEKHTQHNLTNLNTLELIYEKYKTKESLEVLCKTYIDKVKVDNTALDIYIKARDELSYVEKLDYMFFIAAYKNDYCNISKEVVSKVFSNVELSEDLKAFLYHIILINSYTVYIDDIKNKILQFGKAAFEKNLEGIYYNSVYMFLLQNNSDDNKLIKYIFERLFAYEITVLNNNIKYIWIDEEEKQEIKSYVIKNNTVIVNACSPAFNIYCLGQRQKSFYSTQNNIKVKKLLPNNSNIYKFFINKEMINIELLITLSKYYINKQILSQEAVKVLKMVLEYQEISDSFRYRVSAVLGKYFSFRSQYDISSGYFSIINPNELTDEELNTAIVVFSEIKDIKTALNLYKNRKKVVLDKVKLKMCISALDTIYKKEVSYICAELLFKGMNEQKLVDNVVKYYHAELNTWLELKKVLDTLNLNTIKIDEKILRKSLYIHNINEDIQNIFVNLYNSSYNEIVKDFIEHITYLILVNQHNINKNLLGCLEKEYINNQDEYILYAIASIYIVNNLQINNYMNEIMAKAIISMQKKEILFPIFKEYKGNDFSYIEKRIPFIYNTLSNKKVYLNYKLKNESSFSKKKMKNENFGLYIATLTIFYNEILEYYIEETSTNFKSEIMEYSNNRNIKINSNNSDEYFAINNAIIYAETLKYSEAENIILEYQSKKQYIEQFGHLL